MKLANKSKLYLPPKNSIQFTTIQKAIQYQQKYGGKIIKKYGFVYVK